MKRHLKWLLWVGCIFLLTACQKEDAELKTGTYLPRSDNALVVLSSRIDIDEEQAYFMYSAYSSYIIHGSYEIDGDYLIITEYEDEDKQYKFKIKGDVIKFLAKESAEVPDFNEGIDWNNISYKLRPDEAVK